MSHYSWTKNPDRKYLEKGLSVNGMYHKYINKEQKKERKKKTGKFKI